MRSEPNTKDHVSRRTVVRTAAWSIPVIAVATATPLAAASTEAPPATLWGTGATVSVPSGTVTIYRLFGQDSEGDPAQLPVGSTVLIVPEDGVTLETTRITGVVQTVNPDGSILFTIVAENVTDVEIRFRPTGDAGSGYSIITSVPNIDPYSETIDVTLR